MLQFASLNFDPSLEQILSTLIAGAVLVLPESDLWPTPGKIVELGVTVADLPTGYWQQWVQECVKAPELSRPFQTQTRHRRRRHHAARGSETLV